MKITIDLQEPTGKIIKSIEVEAEPHDSIAMAADRAAEGIGVMPEDIYENLGIGDIFFKLENTVYDCLRHGPRWHLRLVCIEVHFEGDPPEKQWFSPRRKWEVVHRWACRRFHVAADACPNLVLRADSPDGGLLNENMPIGEFKGCKAVWLIAPGPEPNG